VAPIPSELNTLGSLGEDEYVCGYEYDCTCVCVCGCELKRGMLSEGSWPKTDGLCSSTSERRCVVYGSGGEGCSPPKDASDEVGESPGVGSWCAVVVMMLARRLAACEGRGGTRRLKPSISSRSELRRRNGCAAGKSGRRAGNGLWSEARQHMAREWGMGARWWVQ